MQDSVREVFTVRDLSERWQVSRQRIEKSLNAKALPAFKVGKQWRITHKTVSEIESGKRSLSE